MIAVQVPGRFAPTRNKSWAKKVEGIKYGESTARCYLGSFLDRGGWYDMEPGDIFICFDEYRARRPGVCVYQVKENGDCVCVIDWTGEKFQRMWALELRDDIAELLGEKEKIQKAYLKKIPTHLLIEELSTRQEKS